MLDNIVTEKCMATLPIEILADAKQKGNNNKHNKYSEVNKEKLNNKTNQNQIKTTTTAAATPAVTKTNKTKTLFSWLKNSNSNNNNNSSSNNNNSNKQNSVLNVNKDLKKIDKINQEPSTANNNSSSTTNCTCPSSGNLTTHSTNSISFFRTLKSNKDDDTLREFRGVQTLRNFWNKRITANKETAIRNKSSKQQHITKSVSCLVNAINNSGEPPPGTSAISPDRHFLKTHKLRALSLHDCSRDSPEFDEISLSDIEIQKHLEKDNFYKYKTAEQASKLRELSEHSTQRKLSSGIVLTAGQKHERFDWLKRHEKLISKKTVDNSPANSLALPNTDNQYNTNLITSTDVIDIDSKMHTHLDNATAMPTSVGCGNTEVGNTTSSVTTTSTSTLNETNSSQNTISRRRSTTRQDSLKTLNSCTSSISRDSSNTSLANSSPANGHRSLVKRNSSTRKYSFKTHTRSYHVPRKMHTNKDTTNGNAGGSVKPGNSQVAKLTQQFNEIIQKDKTFLEEIKRRNGVLMTHKGHVYKVVDTAALNCSQSPSVSRNTSNVEESRPTTTIKRSTPSSTVQKNIRKFEIESRGIKPKVPLKNMQVLKKSKELVVNRSQANNNRVVSFKGSNKKDLDVSPELKPQTLALVSSLEIVKEEVKTPLENAEENKILADYQDSSKEKQNPYQPEESKIDNKTKEEKIPINGNVLQENLKPNQSVIYKTLNKSQRNNSDIPQRVIEEQEIPTETSKENKEITQQVETVNAKENEKSAGVKEKTEIIDKEIKTKTSKCVEIKQKTSPKDKIIDKEEVALDAEKEENEEADKQTQTLQEKPNLREEKKCNTTQCQNAEPLAAPDSCLANLNNAEQIAVDVAVEEEVEEEEEKRKRKHKYAKIYEKLRFFTPFAHSHKKQKFNPTTATQTTDTTSSETKTQNKDLTSVTSSRTPPTDTNSCEPLTEENTTKLGENTPIKSTTPQSEITYADEAYSFIFNPEARLLDALEQVDKKLQNLSQESDEIQQQPCSLTSELDEFGQALKPNSSFLHAKYEKETQKKATTSTVIQAVNVSLVNNIEGEQMIMEQKEIQKQNEEEEGENPPPQLPPRKIIQEEPLYEPICVDNKTLDPKTEISYKNSAELKTATDDLSFKRGHIIEEEDIYQTVEEAQNENQACEIVTNSNSPNELDGYEPIENPDDIILPAQKSDTIMTTKSATFDGYEEYTPNVELTTTTSTVTGPAVRKVTDELPDLPKPKRVLPKSPIPLRPAPKPPLPQRQSSAEEYRESNCHESSHYYGGEENIYDTIKSSHCYESLQSMGNKLHSSPSLLRHKNVSDCVSLTSNCYESISHFKRTNNVGQHSGGSSNGSTLTISSENKTNSLYEDSLNSSLHYASRRVYQLNVHLSNGVMKSASTGTTSINGMNGYGGSIGRTSDTSDEWTDVTDNESGDGEIKSPQFIIIRERSKAHKSPDWSRRVRDKRQRKSKSCIEDDDPDHYYEQLSPQALSKRHSLLEPSRTSSLQRNQDSVRVSKRGKQMSYSAHALHEHKSDDSFDSDTDDYYESEHYKNAHNDSGVDIRTIKLPEPPQSSNQMYSFVKKFKNFIVNKKSPNSSKHGGSQPKIYDSSSQFYGSTQQQYEAKTQPLPPTPPASSLQVPETKELSTSENNLIMAQKAVSKPDVISVSTEPRKSKSGKSLRMRIRKSLVGFDNKQLSTLTPTRSTFYIEDPGPDDNNGQLDSGFSEKALSGELPTTASTPVTDAQKFSTIARKAKKEAKLANSQRRRTTIGIRPHEPPPPPPPENNTKTKRQSNTSWYAECGVFKNGTTNLVNDDSQILNGQNGSGGSSIIAGSTWYEEAGLYQTSGVSVASSSGSSGVSTSNEAGPADEMSHSMFSNEPLYQIYSAAKLQAMSRDMQDGGSSTDGYEEIGERQKDSSNNSENVRKSTRPSALQLVEPKSGPERTLWCHIPEVINSYIIPTMSARERALMEAKFEIITSEASYLKSLNLLRTHYMNHPVFRDQNVVSSRDRKSLFAHIVPVHECSEKLLSELESCWQDNIMLIGLSKRIYAIAEKHFHVYVGFCEHQGRMDRTLKRLREAKGLFAQNLELLESSPACCGLTLHSFLMLPMQRITRLPLLIDAVFSKCHHNDDEYENWKMCLAIMNKIVTQCNEAANKSEQAFEIERISRQLEFNSTVIRPLAIAPAGILAPGTKPRYLVKKGELTHLIWRGDDAKLTFGKKFTKTTIFAFLFSDLLVLTKRKAEEQFSVFDYCPRNMLTITSGDTLPQLPTKDLNSQTSKNLILMTLLENHERKTIELLLSCPSVSEQQRWLQAMRPPESETPGEKLYEQWDCPQVIATHIYENNEPDVLNLEVGDVVNVTRKLPDGWYQGERIRDGAVGWFPGSYTEEVNSVHVRARNLKQRHRLLTFTATYLESQKRNK